MSTFRLQRKPHTRSRVLSWDSIIDPLMTNAMRAFSSNHHTQFIDSICQPIPWCMLRIPSKGVFQISTLNALRASKMTPIWHQQKHAHVSKRTWLGSDLHSQVEAPLDALRIQGPCDQWESWTLDRRQIPQRRPEREMLSKELLGDLGVGGVDGENKYAPFYVLKNILDLWIWRDWPHL